MKHLVYKDEIHIQIHFLLTIPLSSKHTINLSMSDITNKVEITAPIAHGQEQPPPSEHVTESDGHKEALIPDVGVDLSDGTTHKHELSIVSGMLFGYYASN